MAQATAPAPAEPTSQEADSRYGPTDWLGGWRTCIAGCAAILALFVGLRIYQGFYAWTEAGLNSASPGFTTYWFGLFAGEVIAVVGVTLWWWASLVKTGEKLPAETSHREEVRRIAVFWGLIAITALTLYFMASFFPNQDSVWHQTAVRDTALTPGHVVMFFLAFPLGITFSIGTYLYGRTRLPAVYGAEKGFPWSFALLIAAAVTEMAQVAMNEWGHSLWITEEVFVAPFHWPFVTYGWLASGMFALWAETIIRLLGIEGEIDEQEAADKSVTADATA